MKESSLLYLKLEKARGNYERAKKAEHEASACLWDGFDSICGEENLIKGEITLFRPNILGFSHEDIFIRKLLGLQDQKELTDLSLRIERSRDLSTFLVKLETREDKVFKRKFILFRISNHGTKESPIWGSGLSIRRVGKDKEQLESVEFNQPEKSFERLKNGLRILEFIDLGVPYLTGQSLS